MRFSRKGPTNIKYRPKTAREGPGAVGAGTWPHIYEGPPAPPSAQRAVAEMDAVPALDARADLPRCHTCIATYKFSI